MDCPIGQISREVILHSMVIFSMLKHDILIIGGGLAGLRAAIELSGKCDAAILCKTYPNEAHSTEAQGGINAAINQKDNWQDHAYDTAYGGDFLNDQDAVEVLCSDAPRVINELVEFGVNFNKTKEGAIAQRAFGAQKFHRTCFAADRTGHALLHSLYKKAIELGVVVYNEWQVVALSVKNKKINGVIAVDRANGEFTSIQAKAVILATGGAGRVYGKTTNPANTGDGIAIAYNAGAGIMDMEMVQFHPTTIRGTNKLLSEAARGEGAYLINAKGERFMKRYAPDKMELASRDVVSRAEATEIMQGRGVLGDSVYLDFRHLDPEIIMSRVPDIRKNALDLLGIDIIHDPVPVQPGQHYTMAGVATDIDCKTDIPGLFAAGECACVSVHGANRLGGNSLMETLVFGRRAGMSALAYAKNSSFDAVDGKLIKQEEQRAKVWIENSKEFESFAPQSKSIENSKNSELMPRDIRIKMGKVMDDFVGPFRDGKMLETAKKEIAKLKKEYENVAVTERSSVFNAELQAAYEVSFMLELAECIVASAMHRTESRGAHTRTDYPKRDDKNWLKHIVCYKQEAIGSRQDGSRVEAVGGRVEGGGPRIVYRDVKITKWKPVERKY